MSFILGFINQRLRNNYWNYVLLLIVAAFFARAYYRILWPEVWVEDGTVNLRGYLDRGFISLWEPQNGYLFLGPRLLTMVSASISVKYYPEITTFLAGIVTIVLMYWLSTARLVLQGGVALALAFLLQPSNPEVFGLPSYIFWWLNIPLLAAVFWDPADRSYLARLIPFSVAALSSPVILPIIPLLWLRAFILRSLHGEAIIAIVLTVLAATQLYVMKGQGVEGRAFSFSAETTVLLVSKFFGAWLVGNLYPSLQLILGWFLLAFLFLMLLRHRRSWVSWALAYLIAISVLMSIQRVDLSVIHHKLAGPRYFFYPFGLISWALIQVFIKDSTGLRYISVIFLLLSLVNSIPVLSRSHDDLRWRQHINSCPYFDAYEVPIHYDGMVEHAWKIKIKNEYCATFLDKTINRQSSDALVFPYRKMEMEDFSKSSINLVNLAQVVEGSWSGHDFYTQNSKQPSLPCCKISGSYVDSDKNTGSIRIKMQKGQRLWVRCEGKRYQKMIIENTVIFTHDPPCSSQWELVEFSNALLPEVFVLRLEDGGDGPGEWMAIGTRS